MYEVYERWPDGASVSCSEGTGQSPPACHPKMGHTEGATPRGKQRHLYLHLLDCTKTRTMAHARADGTQNLYELQTLTRPVSTIGAHQAREATAKASAKLLGAMMQPLPSRWIDRPRTDAKALELEEATGVSWKHSPRFSLGPASRAAADHHHHRLSVLPPVQSVWASGPVESYPRWAP